MTSEAPRWLLAVQQALEKDPKANVIQVATVDSSVANAPPVPHVRSHIQRTFLTPISRTLPLLVTTTDIRTPKASQIAQNSHVEVAWWIAATQEQFRISGRAYVWPSSDYASGTANGATESGDAARTEINARKLADEFPGVRLGGEEYDWEKTRKELFDTMSGHMKASWVRPVPGSVLPGGYETAKQWPEKIAKLGEASGAKELDEQREALQNFALLVIEPYDVDYVELGVVPNQRTRFTKTGNPGAEEWVETILVP